MLSTWIECIIFRFPYVFVKFVILAFVQLQAVSLCPTGAIEVMSSNKSSGSQETSPSTSSKTKTPKEAGEARGPVRKVVPDEGKTND